MTIGPFGGRKGGGRRRVAKVKGTRATQGAGGLRAREISGERKLLLV